jgi:hypothetical protein
MAPPTHEGKMTIPTRAGPSSGIRLIQPTVTIDPKDIIKNPTKPITDGKPARRLTTHYPKASLNGPPASPH